MLTGNRIYDIKSNSVTPHSNTFKYRLWGQNMIKYRHKKGGASMDFSTKLKELRGEKGISQAKLAADIHISRSAVAKWENGLGLPNDESLKLLADYFGITIDELSRTRAMKKSLCRRTKPLTNRRRSSSVLRQVVLSVCLYWGSSSLNRCERAWFS